MNLKTICVYCGSSDKIKEEFLDAAGRLGMIVAQRGLKIVYGGGSTGMMGALANGALQSGGEVIGVIPQLFNTPKLAQTNLTRLEVVADMHERKARMARLADAFIALPGGFGTLEELFEIITWAQIGLHQKPIGLLNTENYFEPLLAFINHADSEGFIYSEHQALLTSAPEPDMLLASLKSYRPPSDLERWLTREG